MIALAGRELIWIPPNVWMKYKNYVLGIAGKERVIK